MELSAIAGGAIIGPKSLMKFIHISSGQGGTTLYLNCQNIAHAKAIGCYLEDIAPIALGMGFDAIAIRVGAREICNLPIHVILQLWERKIMSTPYIPTLEKQDLQRLSQYRASGVITVSCVEMLGDRGLWCSTDGILRTSGRKAAEWVGEDMSRWWIDAHLQQFKGALEQHQRLTHYQYRALLMTGEPRLFTTNARLIYFEGKLCRLVEVLACEPT